MLDINLDEVKIFDDKFTELEILKKLIDEKKEEEPIHMLNVGDIHRKYKLFLQKLPRVVPYYAVKCNPQSTVIKVLAALGVNFDCASKGEIIQVMRYGVSSKRIIYAHPLKFSSHIEYAKKVGVAMMTVDTEDELKKIKEIYPEAKIVIRIRCDTKVTTTILGEKFGCDPGREAVELIKATLELGLKLHGFSFHVGSPCGEVYAFCRGISFCKNLIDTARSMGCKDIRIIDIGGGIPGEHDFILDEFSDVINNALENIDLSIQIIAEPGRYYVASAFTSAAYIFGKKTVMKEEQKTFMYYISDGIYGSFIRDRLHNIVKHPFLINNPTSNCNEKYISTVWGPTCDSYDVILKGELLPEFNVGDWLAWLDIGAYTTCFSTEFNGFQCPRIYPIIKQKDWDDLWTEINNRQNIER